MDRVQTMAARLWALDEEGYWVTWRCYVGSHGLEHDVELDRLTLERLLGFPGELWLDVYEAIPNDLAAAAEKWSKRPGRE